ncbi:MAG: hypothetical protein J5733_12030, partial [Bacteroidaceae bacterium]|nr:hypothetical protein [Bacteroidaceae bacterium]
WLGADKPLTNVIVKLTDNNDDDAVLSFNEVEIPAPEEGEEYEGTLVECEFNGDVPSTIDPVTFETISHSVSNFKIAFDFGGGQDSTTVTIKDISLVDLDYENEDGTFEEKELWVGTHYFNYFDMHKRTLKYMVWDVDDEGNSYQREATEDEQEWADPVVSYESVNAPELTGRVETLAWTKVDFDDTMWDDQMMPVGATEDGKGVYMAEQQSMWPNNVNGSGHSTNYWIRRNFELDKVNERLSYELNVCHDDVYETYVNGILLQKNVGWTNGKNPVQVHIPAKYLNVGKNVIATYIQQNWGGKFYDCGINVMEVNPEECKKLFDNAIAYAQTDTLLTNKMREQVNELIAEAKQYYQENSTDAAELRNYARDLESAVKAIFRYSSDVKLLKDTYDICRKMEDKGWWRTTLEDTAIALDTCSVPSQWSGTLASLRDARRATAMERHTEKYVGCAPEAVTGEEVGDWDGKCPKYYVYNVGAKNFLGGGEAYGTHLALEYVSTPMMLIQATKDIYDEDGNWIDEEVAEGGYFFETFRPNGDRGAMDFMGWNAFIDIPQNDIWEVIPVEGKENVYNIAQYGQ